MVSLMVPYLSIPLYGFCMLDSTLLKRYYVKKLSIPLYGFVSSIV